MIGPILSIKFKVLLELFYSNWLNRFFQFKDNLLIKVFLSSI